MSAQRTEEMPKPRRSLLPAEFTLKFRRLDEAGESWEVDYGAGTVRNDESCFAPLLNAATNALMEVRLIADAGRESQARDAASQQAERKTGGAQ